MDTTNICSKLATWYSTGKVRLNDEELADAILLIVTGLLRRNDKRIALLTSRYGYPGGDARLQEKLDFLGGGLYREVRAGRPQALDLLSRLFAAYNRYMEFEYLNDRLAVSAPEKDEIETLNMNLMRAITLRAIEAPV